MREQNKIIYINTRMNITRLIEAREQQCDGNRQSGPIAKNTVLFVYGKNSVGTDSNQTFGNLPLNSRFAGKKLHSVPG